MLKIKDIPNGSIVWKGYTILGIKGATLDEKYYDYDCKKVLGNNEIDYEISFSGTLKKIRREVEGWDVMSNECKKY